VSGQLCPISQLSCNNTCYIPSNLTCFNDILCHFGNYYAIGRVFLLQKIIAQ
jgi:hypothetical protein